MEIATKKFIHFLLSFVIIAFLSMVFFGMSQTMMGIEKQSDGTMSGCIFSGKAKICTMTFFEHVNYWQSMFTVTPSQKAITFALLGLFAAAFVAVSILKRSLFLSFSYYVTRWRLYIKHNPHIALFDPFRVAFSQGILNPKIY